MACWGAYGLKVTGPRWPAGRLAPCPASWQPWTFAYADASWEPSSELQPPGRAAVELRPSGWAVVDRTTSSTALHTSPSPDGEAFVHPHLASTAAVVARWARRPCFHAGSFVVGGKAWAVLAGKGGGKTSILAWMAGAGLGVLADDVLVLDGDAALAGPRLLDLRSDATARFTGAVALGVVGTRERHRLALRPVDPEVPFAGFIVPAWGGSTEVTTVPVAARFRHLMDNQALLGVAPAPEQLLDLVARPMLGFARPRRWDALDPALEELVGALSTKGKRPLPRRSGWGFVEPDTPTQ